MSFVCEVCDKEFARKFNLDRHQETKHRDESAVTSEEVVVDPETGSCRKRDVFDDDSDMSHEHETDALDSSPDEEDEEDTDDKDEASVILEDEVTVSDEDESVVDSEEADLTTETDSDQSDSESDASSDVSSDPASPDGSDEYGYDSGSSGSEPNDKSQAADPEPASAEPAGYIPGVGLGSPGQSRVWTSAVLKTYAVVTMVLICCLLGVTIFQGK
ncbi:PREDICTED: dentin sialophosphoprotein-like [Branchiostoma belcheri]|uniref:Dentin sialophosphoprotein-like n=1 Tax=Branchiostoma belcheri TaxID=7741 RepID=A0A6P5AM64_BRABE|nr:PREDICTED: dentin sialophosphoprotein-like [Branchiostoma belcheri]